MKAALEREKTKVEALKQQADTKIKALQKQAATASPETKTKIEQRVAEIQAESEKVANSMRFE